MAFRFPLTTVLRVRVLREEREERVLQSILLDITRARESTRMIQNELRRMRSAAESTATVYGRELHLTARDVGQITKCLEELEKQIEKLEQLKDAQLRRYQAARQDRELLEELCKKHHAAHIAVARKVAQGAIDDVYLSRRMLRRGN